MSRQISLFRGGGGSIRSVCAFECVQNVEESDY